LTGLPSLLLLEVCDTRAAEESPEAKDVVSDGINKALPLGNDARCGLGDDSLDGAGGWPGDMVVLGPIRHSSRPERSEEMVRVPSVSSSVRLLRLGSDAP
jgi:hypothetical protein